MAKYKEVCDAGILHVFSHGNKSSSTAAYAGTYETLYEWCIDPETGFPESGLSIEKDPIKDYHCVVVSTNWLDRHWAPTLNKNKAIVSWTSCHSSDNSLGTSVMDAAGGRWRIGYEDMTYNHEAMFVNEKFFKRMKGAGSIFIGTRRTAGEAWDEGVGYEFDNIHTGRYEVNVRMRGNDWTTLCPAPMRKNAFYPAFTLANDGYGCLIFDTYMNDTIPATDALESEGGSTSNHRWEGRTEGKFILGFDYDVGGVQTEMRAVGNKCRSKDIAPETGRAMDADRYAPSSTDAVPENFGWGY